MQQGDGGSGEMDGGEKGINERDRFFITRETPNQQLKNRVTYDYRTLTLSTFWISSYQHPRAGHREYDISMSFWTLQVSGYAIWAN
jgi:hypothetical protein